MQKQHIFLWALWLLLLTCNSVSAQRWNEVPQPEGCLSRYYMETCNMSKVVDMRDLLNGYTLFNQPIGNWNVSNVRDMSFMFYMAVEFSENLEKWDVSKVEDMQYMFSGAYRFNGAIGTWDVSRVKNMSYMFDGASNFNQSLKNWNVSNVTNMRGMFVYASNLMIDDFGKWDVSNVTDMSHMFKGTKLQLESIAQWDVSNVRDMTEMFAYAEMTQDLSQWCVQHIPRKPIKFDDGNDVNRPYTERWIEAKQPQWGTCPRGENKKPSKHQK